MKMMQVEFHQPRSHRWGAWTNKKVVWVDASWKLKLGQEVTFKWEDKRWRVFKIYSTNAEFSDLERKWGLGLPTSQRTER